MKIFKILEYQDGGPNDRGQVIAYVEAVTEQKAREIVAKERNNPEIVTTGFYEACEISIKEYLAQRTVAREELNKLRLL